LDLGSFYHSRVLRWAGHVARTPMSRAPLQLLTGGVTHSRPIGRPETNFGRMLKRALKGNDLFADFVTWSTIARGRSRWRLLTHSPPSDAQPSDAKPSDAQPASYQPQRPSARLREPFPCLRLCTRSSPKRNTPIRAPPTAPPFTLPAPTAPAPHLSSTILRKASRSATEEEDS
jgi:hypothetical protein